MRILILNYEFPPLGGGGANATYNIGRNLVTMGHEVAVITSSFKGLKNEEIVDGIKVYRVPTLRKNLEYSNALELLAFTITGTPFLYRYIKKNNPDVIHSFFGLPCGLMAYVVTRFYHKPHVLSIRGSDVPYYDPYRFKHIYPIVTPIIKIVWKGADKTVANSQGLKDLAIRVDPEAQISVIPNGIDLVQFSTKTKTDGSFEILAVGRAVKRKGFQYLIAALPDIISQATVPVLVKIVGDGAYLKDLEKLAKELKVENYIQFTGLVDHKEIHKVYTSADVFVLPSLAEGMANVILEAIASGLPVITTDTGGTKELINGNGFIIPAENPKAISNCILKLMNDKSLKNSMSAKSRSIAEGMSWNNISKEYLNIYYKVIRKTP